MTDVVSKKPRLYKAHVMVIDIENEHVCDKCCVTKNPGCYLAYYLTFNSGKFSSTSPHMYDSWFLPIFLLRDGLLSLMKMVSLMHLAKFWSSLPTMLKLSIDISWPVVLWWSWMGDWALMCSLYLSANVLSDSTYILPHNPLGLQDQIKTK